MMSFIKDRRYHTDFEDTILPSQASAYDWLQFTISERRASSVEGAVDYTGKWLIFRSIDILDELWPKLKLAAQQQKLGHSMKSSTAKNSKLICIYTKDWRDVADIRRVLITLRQLGITERLYYKADEQTNMGVSGSIYCSPYGETIEITPEGREWYRFTGEPVPALL